MGYVIEVDDMLLICTLIISTCLTTNIFENDSRSALNSWSLVVYEELTVFVFDKDSEFHSCVAPKAIVHRNNLLS